MVRNASSAFGSRPQGVERDLDARGEPGGDARATLWSALPEIRFDPARLARRRVVSAGRLDPAALAFDVLRTRMLRALKERGWRRVAITSPTQACGKTFVAANLALAMARVPGRRTLLLDMDLRIPSLAKLLEVGGPRRLRDVLSGGPIADQFLRVPPNLVLGLNTVPEADAAELLQDPATAAALAAIDAALEPDVVLYDLPPVLACDDVIAFLPQIDAVLLVARGGVTRAEDVRKCETLFGDQTPLLGVVLNDSEDPPIEPYGYAAVGR